MKGIVRSVLGTALVLALCAEAQAQSRGRHVSTFPTVTPTSVRMVRPSAFRTTAGQAGGRVVTISDPALFSFSPFALGAFPAPGLGFDFAHFAAISRNFKASDISVLSTAQRLALARHLSPVVPFGVPFLLPGEIVVVQQPPIVVLQPAAVPEEAVEPASGSRSIERKETVEPARLAEPLHDLGEFVLVRRDGRVVFAVAFSTAGDLLTYVTREGVRRSMPLADLDMETTLRMNEERGTTLRLPV